MKLKLMGEQIKLDLEDQSRTKSTQYARNPTIYNIMRWFAGPIEQTTL